MSDGVCYRFLALDEEEAGIIVSAALCRPCACVGCRGRAVFPQKRTSKPASAIFGGVEGVGVDVSVVCVYVCM